jgi:MFS family permease
MARQENKIWNAKFVRITIINFLLSMGQFMINTLLPKYADSLGASATVVGVVSGMFAVTALGIRPIAGPAMDYFQKNKLMRLSVGLIVIAFIGYGLSKSVFLIIISRLVHGLGVGVAIPLSMAMASNALPREKMASGMSIFSLGNAVGTAVGPAIGLKLMQLVGYNITFFVVAGILGVCFIITLLLTSGGHPHEQPFRIQLNRIIVPDVIVPAILMFFIAISYSSITYFLVIYGGLRGVENIGLYFTAYAVFLLVSRPVSGRIADKYGLDKTIIPGLLMFAASFILIGYPNR